MKKIIPILALLFLTSSTIWAQFQVTGTVISTEDNLPIIGASILEKGTTNGVVTDLDGKYAITVGSAESIIQFSYTGLETVEFVVGQRNTIDVNMSPSQNVLDEVVVIGYGTSSKKELTGAVNVVSADEIEALNPTRLEQALQGQGSGVQISSQSGSPGGGFNIRIRGISTNGDNRPLILVDGVRYEDLSALDPADIESVNVLKDATASIYGVQAANGVILITTKKGKKNSKPRVNFDAYIGQQETSRKIPVLNATEYAILVNESYANGGSIPPFNTVSGLGTGTDWQDEVFQTAPIQSYNLSVNGGGDKIGYSVGGAAFTQDGIVGGDKASFERYSANVGITADLTDRLVFDTKLIYSHQRRKTLNENAIGSVLFNALNMAPTMTPFDENGDFTLANGLGNEVVNPLQQIANTHNNVFVNRVFGNASLQYTIMDGLSFKTKMGFNFSNVRAKSFAPIANYGLGKVFNTVESSVSESQELFYGYQWDNILSYNKTYNDVHTVKVTLGTSLQEERYEGLYATGFGIPNNDVEFADLSQATEIRPNGANSGQGQFRLASAFGRLEYGYNLKYLASLIVRRDGTSRFGPENRFGTFAAGSLAWVLTEEDFLKDSEVIDFLKLRLSYGVSGNDKIRDFGYVSTLSGEGTYVFDGGTLVEGTAIGALPNPEIRWERNKQFNAGIDLYLLNGDLTMSLDYFNKENQDLLLAVPVSGTNGTAGPGGGVPLANAGSIRNTGFELSIGYQKQITEDLNVNFNYNVTRLNNETLSLNDGVAFIQGGQFGIGQLPPTRWEVGQPIGYFYGYETDGIFQNQSEVDAGPSQQNASVGDLRYVDQNGDGAITVDDRVKIGSPIPDYIMGFSFGVNWKGFDMSALADAQIGNELVRNYERNLPLTNKTAYYKERWHGANTTTYFPRMTIGANDNDLFSDFWVEKGDYLRVKNVQLGYTLPSSLMKSIGVSKLRIYGSINNLFTFTAYQGYDPNISSGDPLNAGIDIGYYPQARVYMLGVNANF